MTGLWDRVVEAFGETPLGLGELGFARADVVGCRDAVEVVNGVFLQRRFCTICL